MPVSDQAENLRRKLARTKNDKQAKTISVISGKGGVGKSSFAVNFGLVLTNHDYKVLIIDLDIGMGNIEIMLGLHAEKSLMDMLEQKLELHQVIAKGPGNLSYISGGSGFNFLVSLTQRQKDLFYERYMELSKIYHFIIFDMGAGITEDSLFFILCSDECVAVTTPEPTALTDAYSIIKLLVKYRETIPINIVMNRCRTEKEGEHAFLQFNQIIHRFLSIRAQLFGLLLEDKAVPRSIIRQSPYVLSNRKTKVSRGMKQLVASYISTKNRDHHRSHRFIQRLKLFLKK